MDGLQSCLLISPHTLNFDSPLLILNMVSPSQAFARRSYECRTPRLLIRTPTSVDEEVYNTLSTDQKHYPYEKAETELARETITEFIKNMPNYSSAGAAAFFVIELRETVR